MTDTVDTGPVAWHDSMSVGITAIDSDHQELIHLLNAYREVVLRPVPRVQDLGPVLDALTHYVDDHFVREERLMENAGYPDLPRHQAIHRNFRATVRKYHDRFYADPATVDLGSLHYFLKRWLLEHIMIEDKAIEDYVHRAPDATTTRIDID